MILCNIFNQCI